MKFRNIYGTSVLYLSEVPDVAAWYIFTLAVFYLCDFAIRDIKITVYLDLPRKISFYLASEISEETGFNYS